MTIRLISRQTVLALTLLGGIGGVAVSAESPPRQEAIHDLDRTFLNEAAQMHLYELEAGKLAEQSAQRLDLKQFAKKTLADSETTSRNLQTVAEKRDMALPTTPNAEQRRNLEKLGGLQGAAFDRAFLTIGAQYQFINIEHYKRTAERSLDTTVKGYARRALPDLERRRSMFNTIALAVVPDAVKPSDSTAPSNRMTEQ